MRHHSPESLLGALRGRGVVALRGVTLRRTRTVLFSVTRRGSWLNLNEAFRAAPPEILDALAVALGPRRGFGSGRDGEARAQALERIRAWPPLRKAIGEARSEHVARYGAAAAVRARCRATPEQREELRRLYERLNAERFGGRLPAELPIRVSGRMRRRLGHVRYAGETGERRVLEIALGEVLLLARNAEHLLDTMLHEMAHVEAFLEHGEKRHGAVWKRIARRVGCEPLACTRRRIGRR